MKENNEMADFDLSKITGREPPLVTDDERDAEIAYLSDVVANRDRELAALRARVAELEQLLDEGSAYVHSFAMLSKHPTAPAYAMDLSQRMRVAAGLSGNKSPQCFSTKETDRG